MGIFRRQFLVVLLWVSATAAMAQERDAQVLRPGEVRVRAGAEIDRASQVFANGERQALGDEYAGALTPETFPAVAALSSKLQSFLDATGGTPPGVAEISGGDFAPAFTSSSRVLPLSLSVGLFSRIEIGAAIPVSRNERLLRRAGLAGGTVGLNPANETNAALLARVGGVGQELGGGLLLPIAGSALGRELQRRVLAATGEQLLLPQEALGIQELLTNFPVEPLPHTVSGWEAGDAELRARFQLLHSFRGQHYPPPSGVHYRVAAYGGIRLPTGRSSGSPLALSIGPEVGFSGFQAGAAADLFHGGRFWGTLAADWESLLASDRTEWAPPTAGTRAIGGSPVALTRDPGHRLEIFAIPRVRMTQEISLGGIIRYEFVGAGSVQLGPTTSELSGRTRVSVGFSARYSTVGAFENGRRIMPLEVAAGYLGAVAGTGGSPAAMRAFLQVAVQPRLWGTSSSNSPVAEPTP